LCLDLLEIAPWRLVACAQLLSRNTGSPGASAAQQDALAERLERLEASKKIDGVTLQSLLRLYNYLGEKKGARRLTERLKELDGSWTPAVDRNPYLEPLPGGEFTEAEMGFIESIQTVREQTADDPWARVRALQELEHSLPEPPRSKAYFHREMAFALRDPGVLDRDGSRASVRRALDQTPDDPSVMNEWAYMSALDKVDLGEALKMSTAALESLLGQPFDPMAISLGETFEQWSVEVAERVGAFLDTRGWILYQLSRHDESVRALELASLLTRDGTVQGHLGRARYAVGNDTGAFHHLLYALALGTEDEEEVRNLARHLYDKLHIVPGALETLVEALRTRLLGDPIDGEGGGEPAKSFEDEQGA
jgi:tetratricopeptide (TPR) repeat protein